MIGRIVRSADFERVLGTPSKARSAHFAIHYLGERPSMPKKRPAPSGPVELSTGEMAPASSCVDDSPAPAAPGQLWLGTVVPKRHARRAVTRNLLKRQIREAVSQQALLAHGLWVVRLRMPFEKKSFSSASSDELRHAAATELRSLIRQAARHVAA